MNLLRTRWTAWPAALLLVLSISGVAGASALISFKQPATHVVQTSDQDEDGNDQGENADDQGQDENAETDEDANEAPETDERDVEDQDSTDAKLPAAEELASCVSDTVTAQDLLPRDGESHGEYVSRIAHTDVTGPNGNHGFCVSAAARGLFATIPETPPTTEQPTTECNGWLDPARAEGLSHGEYVSQVAQDKDAVGADGNHGYCVSRAARGDFEVSTPEATSGADSTAECQSADAHGNGKTKSKHDSDTDVEDQDVSDATASCTSDAASKADKAKDKAEKAKKVKVEHGKRRGRGHRP